MSENTPKLDLLMKDPVLDGHEYFNVKTMMNDNWEKIDAFAETIDGEVKELQQRLDPDGLVSKEAFDAHVDNTDVHVTAAKQAAWNAAQENAEQYTRNYAAPKAHTHTASDLPSATTQAQGIVQLNNSTSSTATDQAATANAAKLAFDRAVAAENNAKAGSLPLTGGKVGFLNVNDRTYLNGDGTIVYQGNTLSPTTAGLNAIDLSGGNIYDDRGSGFYMGYNVANGPNGTQWTYFEIIRHNANYVKIKAYDFYSNKEWTNTKDNGSWKGWSRVGGGSLVPSDNYKYTSATQVGVASGPASRGIVLAGKFNTPSSGEIRIVMEMYRENGGNGSPNGIIALYSGTVQQGDNNSPFVGVMDLFTNWNSVGDVGTTTYGYPPGMKSSASITVGAPFGQWTTIGAHFRVTSPGTHFVLIYNSGNMGEPGPIYARNIRVGWDEV